MPETLEVVLDALPSLIKGLRDAIDGGDLHTVEQITKVCPTEVQLKLRAHLLKVEQRKKALAAMGAGEEPPT